jgi:hypothetical protein
VIYYAKATAARHSSHINNTCYFLSEKIHHGTDSINYFDYLS